jgi:hypothetical protein
MKFYTGEYSEELSRHFDFHLYQIILSTAFMKAYVRFCACNEHNLLNTRIYWNEECFEQNLQRVTQHTFYIQHIFSINLTVFKIIEQAGRYGYIYECLYSTITMVSRSHPKLGLSLFFDYCPLG